MLRFYNTVLSMAKCLTIVRTAAVEDVRCNEAVEPKGESNQDKLSPFAMKTGRS